MFLRKKTAIRPPKPITSATVPASIDQLQDSQFFVDAAAYFSDYPERSLMSDYSRALLFWLIRSRRSKYIAEIGTFRAGTTEVMARACWENNWGIIYTADPYGARRCPPIIQSWQKDLRKYVSFHPVCSMDFFAYLDQRRISLDLTLVDGNHDYEYALFDLQMAARRTLPSGVIIMDNAEQSGPFNAARSFLAANPAWRELGSAVASHDPSAPFNAARASFPHTSFIVLEGPSFISIGSGPHSCGQAEINHPVVVGLGLNLAKPAKGMLHYQVTLRGFSKREHPIEQKAIGAVPIEAPSPTKFDFSFQDALEIPTSSDKMTVEIDLSWQGSDQLALAALPVARSR